MEFPLIHMHAALGDASARGAFCLSVTALTLIIPSDALDAPWIEICRFSPPNTPRNK
jgi:hypothetical protein